VLVHGNRHHKLLIFCVIQIVSDRATDTINGLLVNTINSFCSSVVVIGVELEVDEPLREDKHVTLIENLGEQLVVWVRCDKGNVKGTLEHREDLSGSGWVGGGFGPKGV
jgi:hypothetical protein